MASQQPAWLNSYWGYKADTDHCLTWLLNSAMAAGYTIPSLADSPTPTSPQPKNHQSDATQPALTLGEKLRMKQELKKTKRKEKENPNKKPHATAASSSKKYVVKTKELVRQAKMAVSSDAKLSQETVTVWKQAIAARKRAATWFSEGDYSEESNSKHQHFITVLENILRILKPCIVPAASSTTGSIPLHNKFEGLSVEDILDDPEDSVSPLSPTSSQSETAATYNFEFEDSSEDSFMTDDKIFAVSCFFEDLHSMQDFVKDTWQSYRDGKLDAQTAAFVSNAAIALARREEECLLSRLYSTDKRLQGSQKLLLKIMQARKSQDNTPLAALHVTPFDDFVYNRMSQCLTKFVTTMNLSHEVFSAVPSNKPLLLHPDHQHLLDLPEVKKSESDDKFLTQLLMDLVLLYKVVDKFEGDSKCEATIGGVPIAPQVMIYQDDDEFTRGFRTFLWDSHYNKTVGYDAPASLCFGAQIIMDIREIMNDQFDRTYCQFENTLASASNQVLSQGPTTFFDDWMKKKSSQNLFARIGGSISRPFEEWRDICLKKMEEEMIISELRPSWNEMYPTGKEPDVKTILELGTIDDFIKRRNESAILPSKDSNLLPSVPFACGLRILRLNLTMEESGIAYANFDCLAFFLAHLYNALRQTGLLPTAWPEMERFISINMSALFYGRLPANGEEFNKHIGLKIGFLLSGAHARQRMASGQTTDRSASFRQGFQTGPQLADSKVSSILRNLFDKDEEMNIYQCLAQLQAVFQPKPSKRGYRQPELNSLELLKLLRTSLPAPIQDSQFEYLSFFKTCENLLKRIRFTIVVELGLDHFRPKNVKDGEELPPKIGYFCMAMEIMRETSFLTRNGPGAQESPQLKVVGKVMSKFVDGLEKA